MLAKLNAYLEWKEGTWAPTSLRVVRHTLNPLLPLLDGNAKKLWEHLEKKQSAYTRVTVWWKVCAFWDYLEGKNGTTNPYREFRRQYARFFKDKYVRKPATMAIGEARSLIEKEISDPAIKKKALELLLSGMRWTESFTYKDGWCLGKGGVERQVFLPKIEGPTYVGGYLWFLRSLKRATGLKPHDLRKIFLNDCRNSKPDIIEIAALAGWKSLDTARSYLQAPRDRLIEICKQVEERSKSDDDGKADDERRRRTGT